MSKKEDPRKLYFVKLGAEFAGGFLYGAKVGTFDEKMLYECMLNEPRASGIFYNADVELKKGIYENSNGLSIKGLNDMVKFIVDLALEKDPRTHHHTCKNLTDNPKAKWNDMRTIVNEMRHKDTGLRYIMNAKKTHPEKVMFNNQDITA